MKGIKSKVITDEKTVMMHTNFLGEKPGLFVNYANRGDFTSSIEGNSITVNVLQKKSYVVACCHIPDGVLTQGQKYGVSFNIEGDSSFELIICQGSATHRQTFIQGRRDTTPCHAIFRATDVASGLLIYLGLRNSNTTYKFSNFRMWEIDEVETGGAIVRFLSTVILNLAYAGRKEAA